VLEAIIPALELFPPRKGTAWEDHHAFFAFVEREWLDVASLEHYFGPIDSLSKLVGCGQLLQGECLRAIYEEARRQQPTCSMALMWSLNEPWPNAANLSLLSWPQIPKKGYAKVAAACRPVLASLRVEKYRWRRDEPFVAEVWLLSDQPLKVEAGVVEVYLGSENSSPRLVASWAFGVLPPQTNRRGAQFQADLSPFDTAMFFVMLHVPTMTELDSQYEFCIEGARNLPTKALELNETTAAVGAEAPNDVAPQ
jgi:beta-mannosidase